MSGSSSVTFKADGTIARIVEKPPPDFGAGVPAASLIFVLPAEVLSHLSQMTRSPRGEFEIQTVVNQMLRAGYTASGLVQEPPREYTVRKRR